MKILAIVNFISFSKKSFFYLFFVFFGFISHVECSHAQQKDLNNNLHKMKKLNKKIANLTDDLNETGQQKKLGYKKHITQQEVEMNQYAEDIAVNKKTETEETINKFKTDYKIFLNEEYDRETEMYKKVQSRKDYVEMFFVFLTGEIFDIKEIIKKSQLKDMSQGEILHLLRVIFVAKHLILKIYPNEASKSSNSKLKISKTKLLKYGLLDIFNAKNLYSYVDKLEGIFIDAANKHTSKIDQGNYIRDRIIAFANEFFESRKNSYND